MVCVKYCVFTFPLVVTAVQTHGGVQSALRRIHAPTRNEEGTYIRASVASDLDTLSTRKQPNQSRNDDEQIFVGWVGGTPKCFLFCGFPVFTLPYSVWLGRYAFLCRLCFSLSPYLFSVFTVPTGRPCSVLSFIASLLNRTGSQYT